MVAEDNVKRLGKKKFLSFDWIHISYFYCYSNINSVIAESIIISIASCQPAWPECNMRTKTWRRNPEDETCFYCPQVFSGGTAIKVQIELLVLDLTDTIYYPQCSWTRGLCENWWHYSKQLISFQTPMVRLSVFRGNGCDVCTRTSVSTVKCFLPARNSQHWIALLELHQHHTGKEHRETKSSHGTLISQQQEITRGNGDFVYRNGRG